MNSYCFLCSPQASHSSKMYMQCTISLLLADGHSVHVVAVGQEKGPGLDLTSPRYTECGIDSHAASSHGVPAYGYRHELLSYAVHAWLQHNIFDFLCFSNEWGSAFHALQARKILGMYEGTEFIIIEDEDGAKPYPQSPFSAARLRFCKEYCASNADRRLDAWPQQPLVKKNSVPVVPVEESAPWVSLCVAHYNHAQYLPMALQSLAEQDYPHFEVIVADDGSTEPQARTEFARQEHLRDSRFRFFTKENSGPGLTRNFCAEKAHGVYLIFFDADNVAPPYMVRKFVRAMQHSGMDALTCHFTAFAPGVADAAQLSFQYVCLPIGQDVHTGLLENCFGDTNMIIKTEVFRALGGMCGTRQGVEDWELLARLSLQGYAMDVVPEVLFYYRLTQEGLSRNNCPLSSRLCIVGAYANILGPVGERIVADMLIPAHVLKFDVNGSIILGLALRVGITLEQVWQKFFPPKSLQARAVRQLRKFFKRA